MKSPFLAVVGRLPVSWIKRLSRLQWRHPLLKLMFDLAAGMFRHQDGRIQQGEGRGLWFNTGASNAGYLLGTAEPLVQEAFARLLRPGMTVYDVGAGVGFFSVIAARLVGSAGRVVCFEPQSANAERLRHNIALNGFSYVQVRGEALGREDRRARFLVSSTPGWGKLECYGEPRNMTGAVSVECRRLDSLMAAGGLPKPDFIKMDVEGAELGVLEGARRGIEEARPLLLIELHGTRQPVADFLGARGYAVHFLGGHPGLTDPSWESHLVGIPGERRDLQGAIACLRGPGL